MTTPLTPGPVAQALKRAWLRLLAFVGWPVEGPISEHPKVREAREHAERVRRGDPQACGETWARMQAALDRDIRRFENDFESFAKTAGGTVTKTVRNARAVTCGACAQKNTVYLDRQGARLCGACGLPLVRVRYRGAR